MALHIKQSQSAVLLVAGKMCLQFLSKMFVVIMVSNIVVVVIIIIIHEFHRDASLEQNFRVVVIMVVVLLLLLRASHTNTDGWIVCLQIATL